MAVSVSSLIRSAQAARKKQRSYQTSLASYEWSLSAKTYADYLDYRGYLEGLMDTASDNSEALGYMNTIKSAERAYQGAEIQRFSIRILTGQMTTQQKYNEMVKLYYRSQDIGDLDQAQNIGNQLYSLDIQLQNEARSAQYAAQTAAENGAKDIAELVDMFKENGGPAGDGFITLPDGTLVKSLGLLNAEFAANGETEFGYFQEIYDSVSDMLNVLEAAYNGQADPEAKNIIADAYEDVVKGSIPTAAGNLSLDQLDIARREQNMNNSLYSVKQGTRSVYNPKTGKTELVNEFTLVENETDDFVWVRNDDGSVSTVRAYTTEQPIDEVLDTVIDENGLVVSDAKSGDTRSIRNRLEAQGYAVSSLSDGTIQLTTPDNRVLEATIGAGGTLRYIGASNQYSGSAAGLYEINAITGGERAVSPDEISDFGDRLSAPSALGRSTLRTLQGVDLANKLNLSNTTNIINNNLFQSGPRGEMSLGTLGASPVRGANLQPAGTTRLIETAIAKKNALQERQLQAERTTQQSLANPQRQAALPNLNQTPVRQMADSGVKVKQLEVYKPPKSNRQVTVNDRKSKATARVSRPSTSFIGFDDSGRAVYTGTF